MPKSTKSVGWGIIRYAAGSGWCPEADCAAFDGWYYDHPSNPDKPPADAVGVYRLWCQEHPHWIVALVRAEDIRFSETAWENHPGIHKHLLDDKLEGTLCPLKRA